MARRREAAIRVRLSPSQEAVISGGGNVILFVGAGSGRSSWVIGDREMRALVEEYQAYLAERHSDTPIPPSDS